MVIGIVVAVVVVIVGGLMIGRRRSTEASSVHNYRQTLSTLEQLQGRPRSQDQERPAGGAGAAGRPTAGIRRPRAAGQPVPPRPLPARPTRRSLAAMDHGPRHLGAPVLAVVIVAAVVGVILYVGARPHHTTPSAAHTTVTTNPPTTQQSTTTTTSLPARYTAVSTTTSSATYAPATTSYTLSVGASSGTCWMSVTDASGTTVWAHVVTAGAPHSISLSGKATVLIGAPTVATLEIDGVPAVLPTATQSPFTVTLVPAG